MPLDVHWSLCMVARGLRGVRIRLLHTFEIFTIIGNLVLPTNLLSGFRPGHLRVYYRISLRERAPGFSGSLSDLS